MSSVADVGNRNRVRRSGLREVEERVSVVDRNGRVLAEGRCQLGEERAELVGEQRLRRSRLERAEGAAGQHRTVGRSSDHAETGEDADEPSDGRSRKSAAATEFADADGFTRGDHGLQ